MASLLRSLGVTFHSRFRCLDGGIRTPCSQYLSVSSVVKAELASLIEPEEGRKDLASSEALSNGALLPPRCPTRGVLLDAKNLEVGKPSRETHKGFYLMINSDGATRGRKGPRSLLLPIIAW